MNEWQKGIDERKADDRRAGARARAMEALHSLTPGGSEFAWDPERCVAYVREKMDRRERMLRQYLRDRHEIAIERNALYAALLDVRDFLRRSGYDSTLVSDALMKVHPGKLPVQSPEETVTHETYDTLRNIRGDVETAMTAEGDGFGVTKETLEAIDDVMDQVHDSLPEHTHPELTSDEERLTHLPTGHELDEPFRGNR